jgi:hypothetical protein
MRCLVLLAATVGVAAVGAGAIIGALGDTTEAPSPAATPTVLVAIAPTLTPAPEVTRPPATRTPSVPQSTPRVVATPNGTPRPTITPLATPTKPLDLGTAPALKAPDKSVTLQPPASPFTDHDGKSIVLFDTETKTQTDFGPGNLSFSPFAPGKFAYVDVTGEAWLVDLLDRSVTSLGKFTSASFVDDNRLTLGNGPSAVLYDTRTAISTPLSSLSQAERAALQNMPAGVPLNLPANLTRGSGTINVADDPCAKLSGTPQRLCWEARPEDVVLQDAAGRVVHSFRALRVIPAGTGQLLIATPPVCESASGPRGESSGPVSNGRTVPCIDLLARLGNKELAYDDPEFATGTTNLYILDLAAGTTRFIATSRYNLQTLMHNANWPLAADANYVVWTDGYCGPPRGNTRIYDRKAGTVTELAGTYWFSLRNGRLGLGEFGARTIIDPGTQQFLAVLPDVKGDVRWSADYRYAAVSAPQGRGGLCP